MSLLSHDLQVQMRKDLFAAYREVASRSCPSQQLAWVRTVRHPAPRFYVGGKKASYVMSCLARGDRDILDKMTPLRRAMYLDLEQVVLELSQKRQFCNSSISFITSFALTQPAKQFYISPSTFRSIFRYAKRYGIDYTWHDASQEAKAYTNNKNNKPADAVYRGAFRNML